jgi:hypothetical protein
LARWCHGVGQTKFFFAEAGGTELGWLVEGDTFIVMAIKTEKIQLAKVALQFSQDLRLRSSWDQSGYDVARAYKMDNILV